ncbi:MAG: hypothetical protein JXA33_25380 [Anaerolineae bacterium]|nr:hypothetical protein [Anaerolineae bacterium]
MNRLQTSVLKSITLLILLSSTLTGCALAQRDKVTGDGGLLPPIAEWPLVGTVLQWMGVVKETPIVAEATLTPDIPEHRIETWDDVETLKEIEESQQVRIIITEERVNALIDASLGNDEEITSIEGIRDATVTLDADAVTVEVQLDPAIAEEVGIDIVGILGEDILAKVTLSASNCQPEVNIVSLGFGPDVGLRQIAQGMVAEVVKDKWDDSICVEQIIMMPDEIAVEGYRK